jgi:glutaminase
MDPITHLLTNWQSYLGVLTAVLAAAIAVASVIPGDEPERTLQKIVDFISNISRK